MLLVTPYLLLMVGIVTNLMKIELRQKFIIDSYIIGKLCFKLDLALNLFYYARKFLIVFLSI